MENLSNMLGFSGVSNFSAAFVFIGMAVLALAVIALVIWVAVLSSRLRKLTDMTMHTTDELRIGRNEDAASAAQTGTIATREHEPEPSDQPSPQEQAARAAQQQAQAKQARAKQAAAQRAQQQQQARRASAQPQQAVSVSTQQEANQGQQEDDTDTDFFDGYRDESYAKQTTTFGRQTPSIPFGEDRDLVERRASYTADAVSGGFDPDSIDFSRVAGYKKRRK